MKISVLGAGAVGSMLGGLIKHYSPELDVVLIGRGKHLEEMRRQGGVILVGKWGKILVNVAVSDSVADISDSDYLLLTVKSYSTEDAIRQAMRYVGPSTTVISIQNGINQPTLLQHVASDRLVMGMTATKIAMKQPGTISMERNAATVVGGGCQTMPNQRVQAAANLLRKSKLKITVDSHVVGSQYNKLVFNTLGAAASLSDSNFLSDAVFYPPWRNAVAIPLQRESIHVVSQAGIELSRIPGGADAYRFANFMRMLNTPLLGKTVQTAFQAFDRRHVRFSLAEDLNLGKQTEVDFINGEIVRLANQHQFDAPLNQLVVTLVRQLEAQGGGFFSRNHVIEAFESLPPKTR